MESTRQRGTQNTVLYSVKARIFNGLRGVGTVYFPIWWYVAPTIINTFLESYDFTGKTIVPFATSGGSGMGKTNAKLKPSCPGATLLQGRLLNGNMSEDSLKKWVKDLNL